MQQPIDWDRTLEQIGPDPLEILCSSAAVMQSTEEVTLDLAAADATADRLALRQASPEWDSSLHAGAIPEDDLEATVVRTLLLDALNFCFWGQGPDPAIRWRVERNGDLLDGYAALVAALERGIEEGIPLQDPGWLATAPRQEIAVLLRPAPGHAAIPLFDARERNIHELGRGLLATGAKSPATTLLEQVNGSAIALVREVIRRFPSFNDIATWRHADTGLSDNEVRFHKRAQILAGDLSGALGDAAPCRFHDLDQLTAFADYKVPQVLHWLGILRYSDELTTRIDRREHIAAGSDAEIAIRAGTVWGCELLRQALAARGRNIPAHEIDWLLWEEGQSLPPDARPYHLTPTIFY